MANFKFLLLTLTPTVLAFTSHGHYQSAFAPTVGMRAASRVSSHVDRVQHISRPAVAANFRARMQVEEATAVETPAGETFEFQAEVSRVMDIIINSLYSNRDVFLRELVSNAADACDKKRFLTVSGGEAASDSLGIRISVDKEGKTLTIEDSGVGMTKNELVNNLGRIAQSGTAKFMEALGKGEADVNLIGQFGVGFYSAYLVADKVTVVTRSLEGEKEQLRWESDAGNSFTVAKDESEPIEDSGTRLVLHIKEDFEEYLDIMKIKELLGRYSEFVSFPIQLYNSKTEYEQVPDEDADPPAEGEEPKMKSVPKEVWDWEVMNKQKPVWLRKPKEVPEEDYTEFYKSTFKAYDQPLAHTHFSLEGQVEFRALLYIPSVLPFELSRNMFDDDARSIKLYVKRVFINDKFEELIPRWLMFMRGIVDSEDLPLNVGREILQKSRMLNVINKRLVRKSMDMIKGLQEEEETYMKFYTNFGKYMKVGVIEDQDNKEDLAKLCRWYSSSSGSNLTSLAAYVGRMPESQKDIYFVTADSTQAAAMSPAMEKCNKLGFEVLYLVDPVDELAAESINTFEDKRLMNVAKEKLDMEEKSEEEKAALEEQKKGLEELTTWLTKYFENKVSKVEVSDRLTSSPAALVQSEYGMSPTMKRYMDAQAVAQGENPMNMFGAMNTNILEINGDHQIVKQLNNMVASAPEDEATQEVAQLMYDVAALTGGYDLDDTAAFAKRVTGIMETMAKDAADNVDVASGVVNVDVVDVVDKEEEKADVVEEEEAEKVDVVSEKKEEKADDAKAE